MKLFPFHWSPWSRYLAWPDEQSLARADRGLQLTTAISRFIKRPSFLSSQRCGSFICISLYHLKHLIIYILNFSVHVQMTITVKGHRPVDNIFDQTHNSQLEETSKLYEWQRQLLAGKNIQVSHFCRLSLVTPPLLSPPFSVSFSRAHRGNSLIFPFSKPAKTKMARYDRHD